MIEKTGSLYDQIGGAPTLKKLVNHFYDLVAKHEDLIPIFPADLTEVKAKQYLFLTQFLAGPSLYSEKHGHPMLRARHLPFEITPKRAGAWLLCMEQALDHTKIDEPMKSQIFERLTLTAHHMINHWNQQEGTSS
ncbi:globin [Brevibacillus laterosporus]|uniref:Globin n=1 Tax=Brevibacillus laterosporus TaxID=1465 RepID=A0AAP3DIY5_BRELA|nr:globin [Brevibacillus laterosporus]MCR8982175.1 globin [Brevibacillus laterosporus]MCZ0809329.1 globin [Brevibacillus laterosporus]MCZ0827714.1 globin [Brevibacillus laterosporus]MCZ0851654.1 globin [Brevibacillus laterosporus]